MRILSLFTILLVFLAGFACGGAAFIDTRPRPLPAPGQCIPNDDCLTDPQVLGLLASAGLHLAPGLMPRIVGRSPHCVGISSPHPEAPVDLVFFPTRDLRDLLDATPADAPMLMECLALMRQVAGERGLDNWKIMTNGPGMQTVAYLHFHLMRY